ncbi:MAG: thiamine phosphate synthase [Planctomycetota bacterium]|jgi:thiamine-phosphate pyrophosphorylase
MERAAYRIIDANFNRSREAIRLIEEYCRFVLNNSTLTSRAKQLRHELSTAVAGLDSEKLISSRDTLGDVGVGTKVDNQLRRSDLTDCLTAACKRLPEALRALAEVTQGIEPATAQVFEELRYRAYTLEKDVTLFGITAEKFKPVRLYVIISSNLPATVLSLTAQCITGGADCIQLRAKDIEDDNLLALAVSFVELCRDANVVSIINDRVDIAVASRADGVHLGQNDLPVAAVRKLQSSPLVVGLSTHSLKELNAAIEQQPTYVGLGSVFETSTKPGLEQSGLEYVTEAVSVLWRYYTRKCRAGLKSRCKEYCGLFCGH